LDFEDKLLKALLNKLYLVKKKDKYVIFVLGRKKEIVCQNT
jgi:hypothetical protein